MLARQPSLDLVSSNVSSVYRYYFMWKLIATNTLIVDNVMIDEALEIRVAAVKFNLSCVIFSSVNRAGDRTNPDVCLCTVFSRLKLQTVLGLCIFDSSSILLRSAYF